MDEPAPEPDDLPSMSRRVSVTQRHVGFDVVEAVRGMHARDNAQCRGCDPVKSIEVIGKAIGQPAPPTKAP